MTVSGFTSGPVHLSEMLLRYADDLAHYALKRNQVYINANPRVFHLIVHRLWQTIVTRHASRSDAPSDTNATSATST